jgi:hypothetical protein
MERTHFEYEVFTVLRLDRQEIEVLTKACDSHYDAAVRGLSKPSGPGAILNAAHHDLMFGGRDGEGEACARGFAEVRVSRRQLDTLCKATETIAHPIVAVIRVLHGQLRALLEEAGAEWRRLNPESES